MQELVEIRSRLSHFQLEGEDIAEILRGQASPKGNNQLCGKLTTPLPQNPNRTLMSLESETNLSSAGLGTDAQAPSSFDQVSCHYLVPAAINDDVRSELR